MLAERHMSHLLMDSTVFLRNVIRVSPLTGIHSFNFYTSIYIVGVAFDIAIASESALRLHPIFIRPAKHSLVLVSSLRLLHSHLSPSNTPQYTTAYQGSSWQNVQGIISKTKFYNWINERIAVRTCDSYHYSFTSNIFPDH